jgi:uncharacterized membrane protein YdfJ with MMPL/SSD domain
MDRRMSTITTTTIVTTVFAPFLSALFQLSDQSSSLDEAASSVATHHPGQLQQRSQSSTHGTV